jgi:hypothetical protein
MNELDEAAARTRVEGVFAAVDRVGPDRLDRYAVPLQDPAERAEQLDRLEARAEEAGRTELLDEARDALERELMERWTSHLRLAYGAESTMTGRAEDRAAAVTALRDLVAVAVMRDRLEPADAEALAERGMWLLDVGSLDGFTAVRPDVPDPRPGAPTLEDWTRAAAERPEPPAMRRTSPVVSIVVGGVALVVLVALLVTQLGG